MKNWKPFIFEYSRVPGWVSVFAPIDFAAFSFFVFVFCYDKASKRLITHETIHFQQQLELLFVFQWLLYGIFYVVGLIKYRDAKQAYYRTPFEQEAYAFEYEHDYLENRKHFAWMKYKV